MKKLPLFALLLLGGCYATADSLYLPDGSPGYRITCGDYIGKAADCIQKAGDLCGAGGYQMYDAAGKTLTPEAQNQSVIAMLNNGGAKHGQSSDTPQAMFVKCKNSQAEPISLRTPTVDSQTLPPAAR